MVRPTYIGLRVKRYGPRSRVSRDDSQELWLFDFCEKLPAPIRQSQLQGEQNSSNDRAHCRRALTYIHGPLPLQRDAE